MAVGFSVIAWCLIQLRRGAAATSAHIDGVLAQVIAMQVSQGIVDSGFESSIASLQSWAASWVAFHEKLAKDCDGKIDELSKRLIQLETENKEITPKKRDDDDPYEGARSWNAQAAAAERGFGVRK